MRQEKPSGREIAEKAKGMRLLKGEAVKGNKNGKIITFTPADTSHIKSLDDFEEGQIVGVIENEHTGDETDLPPGKHNLFLTNIDGNWNIYAESGGNIVAEAVRVEVDYYKIGDRKPTKVTFNPNGWCFCWCLYRVWFWCILRVCFCF